jgi:hypothetical protein
MYGKNTVVEIFASQNQNHDDHFSPKAKLSTDQLENCIE